MSGPGIVPAIVTAALLSAAMIGLIVISRLLGNGTLGPNPLIGFRLRPLLASDEAWQRGHQAAVTPMTAGGIVGIAALIVSVLVSGQPTAYLAMLGIAVLALLAGVVVGVVRAVQVARRATS